MKATRLYTLLALLLMAGCHGFKPSYSHRRHGDGFRLLVAFYIICWILINFAA